MERGGRGLKGERVGEMEWRSGQRGTREGERGADGRGKTAT